MEIVNGYYSMKYMFDCIILCMQGIISICLIFRIVRVIQVEREQEVPWSKIWIKIKNYIIIGVISATVTTLVTAITSYYE